LDRIKKYNDILGITASVNISELKKIYRERAKELHPDRNISSNTHDDFILLGEAFEFYKQLLEQADENKRDKFFSSKKYPERYYKEKWNVEKRMAARKKAAEQAKMKIERFEKLGYFKLLDKFFFVFDILRFLLALVLLFVLPVFLFFQDQFAGLIIALIIQAITYRLWSAALKRFISIN